MPVALANSIFEQSNTWNYFSIFVPFSEKNKIKFHLFVEVQWDKKLYNNTAHELIKAIKRNFATLNRKKSEYCDIIIPFLSLLSLFLLCLLALLILFFSSSYFLSSWFCLSCLGLLLSRKTYMCLTSKWIVCSLGRMNFQEGPPDVWPVYILHNCALYTLSLSAQDCRLTFPFESIHFYAQHSFTHQSYFPSEMNSSPKTVLSWVCHCS